VTIDYRNPKHDQPSLEDGLRRLQRFKRMERYGLIGFALSVLGVFVVAIFLRLPSGSQVSGPWLPIAFALGFACWMVSAVGMVCRMIWRCPRCGRRVHTVWMSRNVPPKCRHCGLPFRGALGGEPFQPSKR
jgi:DNA-directed RNA polymerase subunit RPC12/RpoP